MDFSKFSQRELWKYIVILSHRRDKILSGRPRGLKTLKLIQIITKRFEAALAYYNDLKSEKL